MMKKQSKKETRSLRVLLGLVELYLETGKPIGSNTLRDHGFQALSSATIRNYFVELEKQGFLRQPHSSGGRIPTNEAFRLYAEEALPTPELCPDVEERLQGLESAESRNLTRFLQKGAETLSEITGYAVFLSSVRFDHDFILDIKLVGIDADRLLCVMITDFGQILTEVLSINKKISSFSLKRIETQIQWRIKGGEKPDNLTEEEKVLAQTYYNEIMVRYLVRYSNFSDEDIFRTGFSTLLSYPEFNDPVALATGLSLFENPGHMRLLLGDCVRTGLLRYWVGSDLAPYAAAAEGCSVIAVPYRVGPTIAGAIGILGPCRMPYRTLFGTMHFFSEILSKSLTKSLLKFKISFRHPRSAAPYIEQTAQHLLESKE
ncbi:MAG: heat-inducible transcriptional repressor HrcA [Chlamydiales bacterium]|nr:heat-inducible transcriptional repressor HrcA [Chlamydiales bacterium]